MEDKSSKILLNEILRLSSLENVKIRFNLMFRGNWNPIEVFKNDAFEELLEGQYWNYSRNKSFKEGQVTLGFIRISSNDNLWLLFHVGKITEDLNVFNGIGISKVFWAINNQI